MDEDKKLKPTYAGTFDEQLSDLYDRIQNREDFSYDMNADPLYQQYKDRYVQQGKLAMKDTMGQAAALTGGYGSTYGQQVGQQAYDSYLQKLGDVVPELYSAAYQRYRDDGNDLLTQYGLVGQLRDTEYSRYRDALGDYNYDQELARRDEETAYNRRISEDETAYRRQQQAYSNLYALIAATGYSPSEDELTAAGMPRSVANTLIAKYNEQKTPKVVYINNTKKSSNESGETIPLTNQNAASAADNAQAYLNYLSQNGMGNSSLAQSVRLGLNALTQNSTSAAGRKVKLN